MTIGTMRVKMVTKRMSSIMFKSIAERSGKDNSFVLRNEGGDHILIQMLPLRRTISVVDLFNILKSGTSWVINLLSLSVADDKAFSIFV
jgi:hypothetical protein